MIVSGDGSAERKKGAGCDLKLNTAFTKLIMH